MIRGSLLALLGLASFVAVYIATAPSMPPSETVAASKPTARFAPGETPPAGDAPKETSSVSDPSRLADRMQIAFELRPGPGQEASPERQNMAEVRDVTPPEMTAGPKVTGPLTRVERPTPPAPEPATRVERLFSPIVVTASIIKARGRDIRLAGIVTPGFDERCGAGSASWPCGRMARAALRGFIRGRAIECDVPPGAEAIPEPATCRVGGDNIAQWLVARGWAKRAGDLYESEENFAREAKIGLWGASRPGGADLAANQS